MRSTVFSWRRKTDEEADLIADLYFICDRDRRRIQSELLARGIQLNGGGTLDEKHLHHPQVRRKIVEKAREMRNSGIYTREAHIRKLQEIRDGALVDENWKVGLAAEVAVGRAAGLYENFDEEGDSPEAKLMPPESMTNDQLRSRLAQLQQRSLPPPDQQDPPVPQGDFNMQPIYQRLDGEEDEIS
jgi:hypothetical protein